MKNKLKILLLSDTHSYIDEYILNHCKNADEVWHAGDIGSETVVEQIEKICPVLRAVYGNIDSGILRKQFPEHLIFECFSIKFLITHICGYPQKYAKGISTLLKEYQPAVLIGGHSHILRVIRDAKHNLLFMNPGAAGIHGFHQVRTLLKFEISTNGIENLAVIELGKRGSLEERKSKT